MTIAVMHSDQQRATGEEGQRATRGSGQGGQLKHVAASYSCTDLCARLLVMNKASLELLNIHLLSTYIFIWDKYLVMELQY